MARPFPWDGGPYENLKYTLRRRISPDTPLVWIGEVTIGSHLISISDEAFRNCLNRDQIRNLDRPREVKVLGYNEDGEQQKGLKLKRNRAGHAVLEGPWESIMQKNGWSRETRISFWGFPYGGRNSGDPCFVLTDKI